MKIATIALIVLLVAFRLLLPPGPGLVKLARRWSQRTVVVCCSIALCLAAVAILLTRY